MTSHSNHGLVSLVSDLMARGAGDREKLERIRSYCEQGKALLAPDEKYVVDLAAEEGLAVPPTRMSGYGESPDRGDAVISYRNHNLLRLVSDLMIRGVGDREKLMQIKSDCEQGKAIFASDEKYVRDLAPERHGTDSVGVRGWRSGAMPAGWGGARGGAGVTKMVSRSMSVFKSRGSSIFKKRFRRK